MSVTAERNSTRETPESPQSPAPAQNTMAFPAPGAAGDPLRPQTGTGRPIAMGLFLFLVLFAGVFGWMATAQISGAVVATGNVNVRGKPKTVQHLDGGIVETIHVDNGDRVEAGDPLVRLDDTLLRANFDIYINRLAEAAATRARLEAERDGAEGVRLDTRPPGLEDIDLSPFMQGQEKLFEAREKARQGQIEQQREKIRQFNNQIAGINGLIASKRRQIEIHEAEITDSRSLLEKGLIQRTRVLSQERTLVDLGGQLAELEADLARIRNSIRETEIAIIQIDRAFREEVLTELRSMTIEISALTEQILATRKQLERIVVSAPVSGVVHELGVFTKGGVVPPGGVLMQIIAVQDGNEVELTIEPQHIDQLYRGQKVTLRFPAFNQRTTPEIFGTIRNVSPTAVIDEKSGMSFYRASVDIASGELARLSGLALLPGMPVEGHIETAPRTVLNYLFKPLGDHLMRTFREE